MSVTVCVQGARCEELPPRQRELALLALTFLVTCETLGVSDHGCVSSRESRRRIIVDCSDCGPRAGQDRIRDHSGVGQGPLPPLHWVFDIHRSRPAAELVAAHRDVRGATHAARTLAPRSRLRPAATAAPRGPATAAHNIEQPEAPVPVTWIAAAAEDNERLARVLQLEKG